MQARRRLQLNSSDNEQSTSEPVGVDMEPEVVCLSTVGIADNGTQTSDGEYKHNGERITLVA